MMVVTWIRRNCANGDHQVLVGRQVAGRFQCWQIPVGPITLACKSDQKITAAINPLGDILRNILDGVQARAYIDDIYPHGRDVPAVWVDLVKVVGVLVDAGFMLNLSKCWFLVFDVVMLGFRLFQHKYQLGKKALGKLLGAGIPRNLKELQAVMGKLLFVVCT